MGTAFLQFGGMTMLVFGGIFALLFCVAPIVMGFVALGRIDGNSPPRSRALALAAIALGVLWLFGAPVVFIFMGTMPVRSQNSWSVTNGGMSVSSPRVATYSNGSIFDSDPLDQDDITELVDDHAKAIKNATNYNNSAVRAAQFLAEARTLRTGEPRLPKEVADAMKVQEDDLQRILDERFGRIRPVQPEAPDPTVPQPAINVSTGKRLAEYDKAVHLALEALNKSDIDLGRKYLDAAQTIRGEDLGKTSEFMAKYKRVEDDLRAKLNEMAMERARASELKKTAPATPPAVGEQNPFDDSAPKKTAPQPAHAIPPAAVPETPAKNHTGMVGEQDPFDDNAPKKAAPEPEKINDAVKTPTTPAAAPKAPRAPGTVGEQGDF